MKRFIIVALIILISFSFLLSCQMRKAEVAKSPPGTYSYPHWTAQPNFAAPGAMRKLSRIHNSSNSRCVHSPYIDEDKLDE